MPTIGRNNGVSMVRYDYGVVATLKYCYILAGSKDPLNSYTLALPSVELLFPVQQFVVLVQQNLTDRGLRVPTSTPVVE